MRLSAWPITDVGRVRSHNEDSHLVNDALGLYLVADGMGGHAAGSVASKIATEAVLGADASKPLEERIVGAHEAIVAAADADG